MGSVIYTMIRTKLVPLITINYDSCSLTVLFSLALESNQRGITRPGTLTNLCTAPTLTHAWIGRRHLLYAVIYVFPPWAVFAVMAVWISALDSHGMFCCWSFYHHQNKYSQRSDGWNNNTKKIQAKWNSYIGVFKRNLANVEVMSLLFSNFGRLCFLISQWDFIGEFSGTQLLVLLSG